MLARAMTSVLLAMLMAVGSPAFAEEQSTDEAPPPTTVEESPTSMDTTFGKTPPYGKQPVTLKEKLKKTTPFIRDTKLNVNLRTLYFYRDKYDPSKSESWALGGSISYQSGYFLDHLGVGATFYTSQPLYAPSDRPGSLVLNDDQDGYSTFGQLYGEIKVVDNVFVDLFRKEYNTPYINKQDNRMTPNTFEAYTLLGTYGGKDGAPELRYGAGYFTKIKPRNQEGFDWMSRAAGADTDRGVLAAGANYKSKLFSFGAVDYFCDDVINIFYAEGRVFNTFADKIGLLFAAQYSDQRSAGDNLLTGSSFFSNQLGLKGEVGYEGALMTLAYTIDGQGANLRSPWGSYPGYTSVLVQDFNRAGEEAFMIRLDYDCSRIGLDGLKTSALWVHGWNKVDPATRASLFNEDEYDVDIQWRAREGMLKGLWPRLRYGHVEQRSGNSQSINDVRAIVNYEISVL
jgi:hypothetical protein